MLLYHHDDDDDRSYGKKVAATLGAFCRRFCSLLSSSSSSSSSSLFSHQGILNYYRYDGWLAGWQRHKVSSNCESELKSNARCKQPTKP